MLPEPGENDDFKRRSASIEMRPSGDDLGGYLQNLASGKAEEHSDGSQSQLRTHRPEATQR